MNRRPPSFFFPLALGVCVLLTFAFPLGAATPASLFEIEVPDIDGTVVKLATYSGNVLLLVNTASKCGYTGQYTGLQALYDKYQAKGFLVLGFPANDFLWQEPGSNAEIKDFCSRKFRISFPMFEKIEVTGKNQHPVYQYLTRKESNPEFSGSISWNFNKFLIGRSGKILARFGTRTDPEAPEIIQAIEKALAEPLPAKTTP
jgi:glutathione peroxidase